MSTIQDAETKVVSRLRAIGPSWWSAVAAGAGAAAVLVPSHRLQAGMFVGGVILAIALWTDRDDDAPAAADVAGDKPCCSDCEKAAAVAARDDLQNGMAAAAPSSSAMTAAPTSAAKKLPDSEINGRTGFVWAGGLS